jgi:hypothetical protein
MNDVRVLAASPRVLSVEMPRPSKGQKGPLISRDQVRLLGSRTLIKPEHLAMGLDVEDILRPARTPVSEARVSDPRS